MDSISITLISILITIITYIIHRAWRINQYWKDRNIPHVKPWLFIGNSAPVMFMKMNIGERHKEICNRFPDEPIVGYYDFMKPILLINGADMIENILIKDFGHFMDRGIPIDEKRNPLDSSLFTLNGKRWKAIRNRMSPIFTSGKLKLMYDTMADCGEELVSLLEGKQEIEMQDILGRFVMDVIGSCGFGIETRNLADPDNEFRQMGKKTFDTDIYQYIKFILMTSFPSIFTLLNLKFSRQDVSKYFTTIINNTIKHRRDNGYKRNDFLQLVMQLQEKGYVEMHTKDAADDYLNIDTTTYSTEKFEISNDEITGHALVFLSAGFKTTTLTIMYSLYELSKHQVIQDKVRAEIQKEVKNAGSLTYDALKEMDYLEQCVKETLRKYPSAQTLFRICTKSYVLPNGVQIEPGQSLIIPVRATHYNPNYYPEPEKFKPERFAPDQVGPSSVYLPFGTGPRICIGMRFALLEIKYCLAKLLKNYKFRVSPKTKEPLTVNVKNFFTTPNEKIIFNISKVSS